MSCRTSPSSQPRFQCYPVEQTFRTLNTIVRRYVEKHRNEAATELATFRGQPSLRECIRQAALSRRPDGKKLNHQRRIPKDVLSTWTEELSKTSNAMDSCGSFESVFDIVQRTGKQVYGIGELTIYDTALRIGAYLKLEPKEIYLHRGTREGAKALGFDGVRRSIRLDEMPRGLRRLKPYEIEDCLCIYKDHLRKLQLERKSRHAES